MYRIEWLEIIEDGTKYIVKLVERKQPQIDKSYENSVFTYAVSPAIFNDAETILEISQIKNTDEPELFPNLAIKGTVIGYNVYTYYDRDTMINGGMEPVSINFYVYDKKKEKISFLVKNENGELVPIEDKDKGYSLDVRKDESFEHTLAIYMDYGSDYETVDPYAGCNEDLILLCQKAHEKGMKVILDAIIVKLD